ncbi:MAG: hypothetical protein ACXVIS_04875 [Halobacteriota archaeon]
MKHEMAIKKEFETLSESDKDRFERIKVAQIEKYGSERPEQLHSALHAIQRVAYQRSESESLKEGNFALLRNARLSLALLMEEEVEKDDELLRKTLATHLDLCYIDLNGPQNSTTRERKVTNEAPFYPNQGVLIPCIVDNTNRYIERLELTRDETKSLFHKHISRHLSGLNPPLSLEDAWNKLEPHLIFKGL